MTISKKRKSICAFLVVFTMSVSLGTFTNLVHAADVKSIFKASSCQRSNSSAAAGANFAINSILERLGGNKNPGMINKRPNFTPSKPHQSSTYKNPSDGQYTSGDKGEISSYVQEALSLLNADRAAHGLRPLKTDTVLNRLAQEYAYDMISRGFFAHENPEGLTPFDRMNNAGVIYRWAGENLAINSSVAAAQKALMSSASHRANILNPNFTHVGIGVLKDAKGSFYVVQEFIGN